MDQGKLDALAAALGRALDRRSGLKSLAAGLVAAAAAAVPVGDPAGARRGARGKRPTAAGPCGDGSRKDNVCSKDTDCCTGVCNRKPGKKNLDGKGRCRCLTRGRKCSADRNCCNTLTCRDGKCSGKPKSRGVPTGDPCTPGGTPCANAAATCVPFEGGAPAGTYCLFARNSACTSSTQCVTALCDNGVCLSCSCGACAVSCGAPTVCPTCTHTTIQGAIDAADPGDTITIAAGTYSESLSITTSLNLRACGAVTVSNASFGERTITVADGARVEIVDLVIDASTSQADSGGGISSQGKLFLCRNTVVRNANWLGGGAHGAGVHCTPGAGNDPEVHVLDQTVIRDNHADSYGGGVAVDSYCASVIANGAQILGNTAGKGGGICYKGTTLAQDITGSALIDGNTVTGEGGGIMIVATGASPSSFDLRISGNAKISGNTSAQYGGGIGSKNGNAANPEYITITGDAEISGNTSTDSYGGGGGGIYAAGLRVRISGGVRISGNKGPGGGGIYVLNDRAPYASGEFGLDISGDVVIENNDANEQNEGGGILAAQVPTRLSGNVAVRGNTATTGGGIFIQQAGLELRDQVRITGNSVTGSNGSGGGLCLKDTGDASLITGSAVISGNTAVIKGGGIFLDDGAVLGSPVTFGPGASVTGNTSNGGAGSGGGLYANSIDAGTIVTGGGVITGNTPDNCANITC